MSYKVVLSFCVEQRVTTNLAFQRLIKKLPGTHAEQPSTSQRQHDILRLLRYPLPENQFTDQ